MIILEIKEMFKDNIANTLDRANIRDTLTKWLNLNRQHHYGDQTHNNVFKNA